MKKKLEMQRHAALSDCGKYRYLLTRVWDPTLSALVFVMLNPSTADAEQDDPTIRKCIGFAQRLGFGGIRVVNLYALRATKPEDLYAEIFFLGQRAKGPHNDDAIHLAIDKGDTVVMAWGRYGKPSVKARAAQVERMVRHTGAKVYCLRFNSDGSPAHPLMLPYSCKLEAY